MSGRPTRLPPPPSRGLLPILTAATFIGMLVAVWGVLSVLLDRDIVDYPDAGPVLGPSMAFAAAIVTWLAAARTASAARWVGPVLAFAGVLVVMSLVGGIGIMLARGDLTWLLTAGARFAISPFTLAAAVVAAIVVAVFRLLERRPR